MTQALVVGASAVRCGSTEFEMTDRDFKDIAAMLYADAGIYMPDIEGDAGLFATGQTAAGAESRELPRLLRVSSARRTGPASGGDAVGADHQRHPVLPRAAPFRASAAPMCCRRCSTRRAAAGGCGCGRRPARPGPEPYSMALTVLAARARTRRRSTSGFSPPTSTRAWSKKGARGVYPAAALADAPAGLAQALFHGARRRRTARRAGERGAASPGRLPHAQSQRRTGRCRASSMRSSAAMS